MEEVIGAAVSPDWCKKLTNKTFDDDIGVVRVEFEEGETSRAKLLLLLLFIRRELDFLLLQSLFEYSLIERSVLADPSVFYSMRFYFGGKVR